MKRWSKKLLFGILLLFLAVAEPSIMPYLGMCETVEAASVKISKTSLKLVEKESAVLKVSGTRKNVKWSSSNKSVATVKKGKVMAKKKGTATITAKVGAVSYSCKVKVVESGDLYKALLEKGTYKENGGYNFTINYFYLLDINGDGIPELVCLNQWYDNSLYVFTIKGGKVAFLGSSGSKISYNEAPKLYFSKKYKALCCIEKDAVFGGGLSGSKYGYYRISGSKMKMWKYTAKMASTSSYKYFVTGTSYDKCKYVNESEQEAFYKKYFDSMYIKSYTLLRNLSTVRDSIWK